MYETRQYRYADVSGIDIVLLQRSLAILIINFQE
jgi:hypothetical protein